MVIQPGTGLQYDESCLSASACNQTAAGDLEISFSRSGSLTQPLGVFYKVINGTAVNGVDFNTPTTGEAIIPAGLTYAFVEVPLVNEGMFGSTKTFTSEITGTSSRITILQSTATDTIDGGNVPTDCSYTFLSGISQSLTCTSRPATQVWPPGIECGDLHGALGTDVTGDGTSTVSGCAATYEFSGHLRTNCHKSGPHVHSSAAIGSAFCWSWAQPRHLGATVRWRTWRTSCRV